MATAANLIDAALSNIIVQAAEQEFSAAEYQDAIFALNNMMLAYDAEGIELGYTEVATLNDEITIPAGAVRGVVYNLAIDLAPQFDGLISPGLTNAAQQGYQAMLQLGVHRPTSFYPSTLPVGTGNTYDNGNWCPRFYHNNIDKILAETTGSIALETNTEAVIDGNE